MFRKTLLGAAFAASLIGMGSTAQAQITVTIAPPAPIYEVAPEPRRGQLWVAGHHEWRNGQYVWVQGHWVSERPGYAFREHRWVQRGNGEWYLVGGNWERRDDYADLRHDRRERSRRFGPNGDLDGDGIRNQDDRDIDGDGVRNRRDSHPYNPRRS
jgi:hypothetical protein